MIQIVKGNLLHSDVDIICQQVNCKGVMGAGLAKQIRDVYPEVYMAYKNLVNKQGKGQKSLLGCVQYVQCNDGKIVANLFGQDGYGTDRRHTCYESLQKCFMSIVNHPTMGNLTIGLPMGIGCGLAGGDWNVVAGMIDIAFHDCAVKVFTLMSSQT